MPVLYVDKKVTDDLRGNHIPKTLPAPVGLEGYADDTAAADDRAAAVPGIDRRVQLGGKQVTLGVNVGTRLDSGNDTLGDGKHVPANRKANYRDRSLWRRGLTQLHRDNVIEE